MSSVWFSGLRREWLLAVAFATTALFLLFGKGWLADLSNPLVVHLDAGLALRRNHGCGLRRGASRREPGDTAG